MNIRVAAYSIPGGVYGQGNYLCGDGQLVWSALLPQNADETPVAGSELLVGGQPAATQHFAVAH